MESMGWHLPWEDHTNQRHRCEACGILSTCCTEGDVAHCGIATVKVLLEMEGRDVLQDLISYVGQLELSCVPIKGRNIDPDVHDIHDGPGNTLCLPTTMEKLSTLMQ